MNAIKTIEQAPQPRGRYMSNSERAVVDRALNQAIDLMQEGLLIGRAWLSRGENSDISELVDRIGSDLDILGRGRSSYGTSSKWDNPSAVRELIDPTIGDGLALLRSANLI